MKLKKKIIVLIHLVISQLILAGGIEKLNFYEETDYNNLNTTYIDYKQDSNSDNYNYILGEGVIDYGNGLYSEYTVKKKYEKNIHISGANPEDLDGYETNLSLFKMLEPLKFFGKELYNDIGIVYFYDQFSTADIIPVNSEHHEFKGRYRVRVASDIGKGGSYSGIDIYAIGVKSSNKSGSRYEFNFLNSTNIGYGLQNITTQYNELMDYDNYNSTYKSSLENIFKWTFDFSENWAFSPEFYANFDKYSGGTNDDYNMELSIIPYILYNKDIRENLNFYSKLGLIGYGMEEYKTNGKTFNDSGVYINLVAGLNYSW